MLGLNPLKCLTQVNQCQVIKADIKRLFIDITLSETFIYAAQFLKSADILRTHMVKTEEMYQGLRQQLNESWLT